MSETIHSDASTAVNFIADSTATEIDRRLLKITSQINLLCDQSRSSDAYALGQKELGTQVRDWPQVLGQLSAAKVAERLGGNQLSEALIFRLRRRQPEHPEVMYHAVHQRLEKCPLARLWISIRHQELPTDDTILQAKWLGLKATILSSMRDFDRSFELFDQATRIAPDDPRAYVGRASAFRESDDVAAAIRSCRDALEVAPNFGPAIQLLTHYLLQSNQIAEAFNVLTAAVKSSQDGQFRLQLANMCLHRDRIADAEALTRNIEGCFPLADPMRNKRPKRGSVYASIAAIRSDLAYQAKNYPTAAKWSALANSPHHDTIVENLKANHSTGRRAVLNVPFVLQRHVTCAPATLTMLSGYWNKQVDMDDVVDEICYDGTAPVKTRKWGEDNGMVTKEFRVTFESAQALIDAGIPFALSTVAPGMGHIQVICGYDSIRGSLLIQDPGLWHVHEELTEKIIDRYRAFGPRGLILIPQEQADRIQDIELPDSDRFDQQYAIAIALDNHDRPAAESIVLQMQEEEPEHWMTYWAEMDLANYDSNAPVQLQTVQKLAAIFPDDDVLWLWENRLLTMTDRADMVIQRLWEAVKSGRALASTRFHLLGMLDDTCQSQRAELLKATLRDCPTSSAALSAEANEMWRLKDHESALELLRLAAMSSEMDEGCAREYLIAATRMDRRDEVLEILKQRFERHGDSSGAPGMTYAWALDTSLKPEAAVMVVREAIKRRPADGDLHCQAATILGRLEKPEVGFQLLDSATTPLPKQDALQARAILAEYDGRPEDALTQYREIEKLQPLNPALINQIASLQVDLRGFNDAINYLVGLTERFPHCRSVLASTASLMHAAARYREAITYIDRILTHCASDAWAWRERSLIEKRCGWHDEAFEHAEQALLCDESAASYTVRGDARIKLGRIRPGKEDFHSALQLDCDHSEAITSWMLVCDDEDERAEALKHIYDQLIEQRTGGEGLAAYYQFACVIIDSAEMADQLIEICETRPDVYAAHMLLANHYRNFRQFEDARDVLLALQDRFGIIASYWRELGDVYRELKEDKKATEAYENGIDISPHDSELARRLADMYWEEKRKDDALAVLNRALQGSPSDPSLMIALAQTIEDNEKTLKLVRKAAMRASSSIEAWELLLKLCQDLGRESEAVDAARELIGTRPCDVNAHMRFAEMLHRDDQREQSLSVIANAMKLDRRLPHVHALFAKRLLELKMYDQALEACSPPEVDPHDAHHLDLLAAQILYYSDRKIEATSRLRDALHRDPTDLENWVRLADWCEEVNNMEWYDEASKALVNRAGHLAVSHCYYATAMIRQNHRERAKEHLQFAIEAEPNSEYAIQKLIQLSKEDYKIDDAEAFLDRHAAKIGAQALVIGRVLVARHTRDAAAFVTTLRDLPDDSDELSQIHIANIACAGLDIETSTDMGVLLDDVMGEGRSNKAIGFAWAHFFCHPALVRRTIATFHKLRHSDARSTAGAMMMGMMKAISQSAEDVEVHEFAIKETNRILKRLGKHVYADRSLWSHALWTLIEQGQHKAAVAIAKHFASVKDRNVDDLVAAMIASLCHHDLKMMKTLLDDADAMGPAEMTENGRMMKAIYNVHCGSNEDLANSIRAVNKNDVLGPFLQLATLIRVGAACIEEKNETKFVKQWMRDYFRTGSDGDPIAQRIYQRIRSRIAEAAGDHKRAKKFRKSNYDRWDRR
jgi:tetratricopeptide (TPR) repeat protein